MSQTTASESIETGRHAGRPPNPALRPFCKGDVRRYSESVRTFCERADRQLAKVLTKLVPGSLSLVTLSHFIPGVALSKRTT